MLTVGLSIFVFILAITYALYKDDYSDFFKM